MPDALEVKILFDDEAPQGVTAALKEVGATDIEEVRQRGFIDAGIVILAVIAIQALANLIISLVSLWKCGVMVDARGDKVHVEKNCDLPRGSVLVIDRDGTKSTLERPSEVQMKGILDALRAAKP